MTLRTLNYGNYGIFLIMGNAGFCPSAVGFLLQCLKGMKIMMFQLSGFYYRSRKALNP